MPSESSDLVEAVEHVWKIAPPGPQNLLADPWFRKLDDILKRRFGKGTAPFALSKALRNLGLPCVTQPSARSAANNPRMVVASLERTWSASTTKRRYLCPLDLADNLPALSFGHAQLDRFSVGDLEALFDRKRLKRIYPASSVDFGRLAQLQWLVIEETAEIDPRPEARAVPIFFKPIAPDLGAFDPLARRYPTAVERALFALLLVPWEDWGTMQEVDWRGFRLPWVYTADEDLAVRPQAPPDVGALTFEPVIYSDGDGEEIEYERPSILDLKDGVADRLRSLTSDVWQKLEASRGSKLFQTPIEHFLVRAYLSSGIDEFLAHITVLEAAVGEEADYDRKLRPKAGRKLSGTEQIACKIAALLDDSSTKNVYKELFNIRSLFVHGRADLEKISTEQKVKARRLARRVANAILDRAAAGTRDRADFLAQLLSQGTP